MDKEVGRRESKAGDGSPDVDLAFRAVITTR